FSQAPDDADLLIEQLIAANSAPRRLTVVSSDHRLHRAARRRRATAVDSDKWYAEVLRKRIDRARRKTPQGKPEGSPSEGEVRFWLRQFGLDETTPQQPSQAPLESPFPPGYAEDIREDDV